MHHKYCHLLISTILCSYVPSHSNVLNADEKVSSQVLTELFQNQHLEESAFLVLQRAASLQPEERYQFLLQWTLGEEKDARCRDQFTFLPTTFSQDFLMVSDPIFKGGTLTSPFIALVLTAKQLNRLQELDTVCRSKSHNADSKFRQSFRALRFLISYHSNEEAEARERLGQFLAQIDQKPDRHKAPSNAEWLVFSSILNDPLWREDIADSIYRYQTWVNADLERTAKRRHWKSMLSQVRQSFAEREELDLSSEISDQWNSVRLSTSQSHGTGCPHEKWILAAGYAENVASHNDDFLYFNTPLTGDFEVECDLVSVGWKQTQLVYDGHWLSPKDDRQSYWHGSYCGPLQQGELPTKLTFWERGWRHHRLVSGNNKVTSYINGAKVHERAIDENVDPWLSIRSSFRHDGGVRNIRITGQPISPSEVQLLSDRTLGNWLPYYDETAGQQDSHWFIEDGELRTLIDQETIDNDSFHHESLLRYHRPLLEDGEIKYEFFYSPGEFLVHPTIGRTVFLLADKNITTHQVTDGKYERTDLSPQNRRALSSEFSEEKAIPLQKGEWNRVKLSLQHNQLAIELNGQRIIEDFMLNEEQRLFGFFHYRDQAAVNVRNVVHRGEWREKLPSQADQRLWIDKTDFLDESVDHLKDLFVHDFTTDRAWQNRFKLVPREPESTTSLTDSGLQVTRPGLGGYCNHIIAPYLQVTGDFDIIVDYAGYQANPSVKGVGTAKLMLVFGNESGDEIHLSRRTIHEDSGKVEQVVQCVLITTIKGRQSRQYFYTRPMEENAGKLRISRRGKTIFYLTAENDSAHYRLRGKQDLTGDVLLANGIHLNTQMFQKGGETAVTWKRVEVRAESLSGDGMENFVARVAQLDQQRNELAAQFHRTFSLVPPLDDFILRDQNSPWSIADQGWKIVSTGTPQWSAAGAHLKQQIFGDYDIELEFDILSFAETTGNKSCSVHLQTVLDNNEQDAMSVVLMKNSTGYRKVICEKRETGINGATRLLNLRTIPVDRIHAMRLSRREQTIRCFAYSDDSSIPILVGSAEMPDLPLAPDGIRLMVHTGEPGKRSEVLLKSIDVRAENIEKWKEQQR